MTTQMRVTYNVRWAPDEREFGEQLADLPQTKAMLLGLANEVAAEAKKNISRQGTGGAAPKLNRPYPKVGGVHFSARPERVADEISVKDQSIEAKFKGSGGKHKIGVTRVALVISNHPYSIMWERGTFGLAKTKFMTAARRAISGKHSGVKNRAGRI